MRIAALALTAALAVNTSAGEIFIPATYRGPGAAGSHWYTEITVANITPNLPGPVPVTITLHRQNHADVSVATPFAPMEVISIPDALASWFDVEEGGGVVRVTWDDPAARITARARVYNASNNGQYGQGVPGVPVEDLVTDLFLPGLSGVDGNRTNVGISNPHSQPVMFWISLHDTSGLTRGAFATSVPARSFVQYNDIFSYFQAGPLHAAMVRVTGTNGTLYAYASVVRNDTGDATFVTPAQ